MQELEVPLAKARFARRNITKMAGIGVAALIAGVAVSKPARARRDGDDGDHDRDDRHCFLKGTRVRTVDGGVAVEDLAIGDLVPTRFSGTQPIQWIGRYRYTRSDASRPWVRSVLPVRVARSAIAAGVPHTDLYVSQQHAIFIDGALVCAGSLVNGVTIALDDAGDLSELEYYHIKLRNHDIIDAQGAPCETLLDVDESSANFVEYLRMYGAPGEKAQPCIPALSFTGHRSKMKSRLRSAFSPFVDRRQKIDIIRDRLEERAAIIT